MWPKLSLIRCAQAVVAVVLLGVGPLRGQAPDTVLTIPRVERALGIDDFLARGGHPQGGGTGTATGTGPGDEPAPGAGVRVTDFRQREPGDGVPVSETTTAYLSYDNANLYVVFVCKDDPAKVRAGLTKREEITADDGVAVYLDTFHDRKRAYVFQTNPNGVQLDGILTEGQDNDYSFDAVWQSDGHMTADGYVVRMAIPFRSLRFANAPAQQWGIALARFIHRNNEESYWPHVSKRLAGFVPQFRTLQGLHDISPGRNLQAIPYGTFTGARFLDTNEPAFHTQSDRRMGVDVKAVVRDALTLDGTVNPDFSQVESDEPQVTINERFETFFPEKRPFFIENAGYFQTPVNLFFSRRIADPGAGLRLTSKAGRWALGAIAINDRTPAEFTGLGLGREPRAGIGVVRMQREIGRESGVGMLVSDRQLAGGANRVASADARLALSKQWIFTSQVIATHARDSAGISSSGAGVFAQLLRDGRNFDYSAQYLDLSSTFDAQLGFVPRVGVRALEQTLELVKRPKGPLVKIGPTFTSVLTWDRNGVALDRSLQAQFEVKLVGETKLKVSQTGAFELFKDIPFTTHNTKVSLESALLKWLAWQASYKLGTDVNHKPPKGVAPFLAGAGKGELTFTLRPSERLRLDHTLLYSRLTTRLDAPPVGGQPTRVFTDWILREKLNYQFSRALSFRAIVDHEAVSRNSTLSRVEPARRWTMDLLLTYLVNPGTALHVGYRDGYENLVLEPGSPPTLVRTDEATTSVGRQLFVKLSYLLRF